MADGPNPENIRHKPAGQVMDDILDESREILQRGARATAELEQLKRRADQALDWRAQFDHHPWLGLGLASAVAVLVFLVITRKH